MLFGPTEDDHSTMTKESERTETSLMSEISQLRSRLRELEDDTKSSVSSAIPGNEEWGNLLKKELAKAENEKAKLEMEYMNHMTSLAVSNQKVVDDLTDRLKKSEETNDILEERLATQNGGDKENGRLRQLLEDERKGHQKEINQIQENLAQADHEIVASRQELDYLHEQVMELEADKQTLFRDLTNARQDSDEATKRLEREREASKRLERQLAEKEMEMNRTLDSRNDAIIQLDGQVTDLQRQLRLANETSDRQALEEDVRHLEQRLERFQGMLTEKDQTVEKLTTDLRDEKEKSKAYKSEVKALKIQAFEANAVANDNITVRSKAPSRSLSGDSDGNPGKVSNRTRAYENKAQAGELANSAAAAVLQRALEREQEAVNSLETQLELEKDISTTATADLQRAQSSIASMQKELDEEKNVCARLRTALDEERENVSTLEGRLASNPQGVPEKEIAAGALRAKVAALETAHADLSSHILERQAEVDRLKDQFEASESSRRSLEDSLAASEEQVEHLKTQLDCMAQMNAMEEEKKSEQEDRELNRLRAQIEKLQSELDRAQTEVEVIQRENESLKKSLRDEQLANMESEKKISTLTEKSRPNAAEAKGQKKFDTEMNALKVELTKVQISKAELETESMTKIKELETELEALETEAEEELEILNTEIDGLKKDLENKEAEITRFESERAQLCLNMNKSTFNRKDEVDELQTELIEMTSKNARQSREVEALKMKIEDYESRKALGEGKLRSRIQELEDQVDSGKQSRRYQADRQEVERFRSENLKLRESIRESNAERRRLQEKLDEASSDRHLSKSAMSLKERNASLKSENDKLNRRLKKMENNITRFAV